MHPNLLFHLITPTAEIGVKKMKNNPHVERFVFDDCAKKAKPKAVTEIGAKWISKRS